ncbi:hypothetical protein PIROE2DRAFT_59327 [Piromyces sp. E2]|nr:hypothetical protein PIROE2DRAFT_59327 [Piromyces sp. E2]|eukprot:OUM66514.1 hypothetical protein PIROE2DRAFT_59327 [Piromyces sp. E2]
MEGNTIVAPVIIPLETIKEYSNTPKEVILNSIQKLEKKIFPKNEQMDILTEVKKRTNTLIIAIVQNTSSIPIKKNIENNNTQEKLSKLKNKKKSKANLKNTNKTGANSNKLVETNSNTCSVIGYLIYSKKDSIIKFAVDPSKRNHGTGWKLLSYSMDRMTNQMPKGHKINLAVDVSRLPAQHLYTKVGFCIKEQINDYYEPGRHAYIMEYFV